MALDDDGIKYKQDSAFLIIIFYFFLLNEAPFISTAMQSDYLHRAPYCCQDCTRILDI